MPVPTKPRPISAKDKLKAERFKKVVYADEVLHLSESELQQILANGFYEISKANNNPYFRDKPYQQLVNTLISQGYLPRYWQRYVSLDHARQKVKQGGKVHNDYIDKYKLVYSRTDNHYHLNNKNGQLDPHKWLSDLEEIDPYSPIGRQKADFNNMSRELDYWLMLYYRPPSPPIRGKYSFDPADIVEINEPLPDFLKIGNVVFSDTLSPANQSAEKTSFESTPKNNPTTPVFSKFKVVHTKKRQFDLKPPINQNTQSLEKVYNLTPHQLYKYKSVEYSKSLLPKNHRLHGCMKAFLDSVKIYIDENSQTHQMHTHGACRCEMPTCVFCNVFDGQQENTRAKILQQTLIGQGYNLNKSTLTYPHNNPDLTQDLPLLKLARRKFYKEIQRLVKIHLPEVDISMNVSSLETPINIKNGINAHFNYVYAIKQDMTSSQKRLFARLQHKAWLSSLVLVGLVAKGDNPERISHVKFNDPNALAYITKYEHSYHTPEQIPEIESRWLSGESISKFELLSLGQYGRVSQSLVKQQYRQLVTALHTSQTIKYSQAMTAFCKKQGLIIDDNAPQADSEPLDHDPDICTPEPSTEPQTHDRAIAEPVTVTQYDLFGEPLVKTYKSRKAGAGRKPNTHKHKFDPIQQQTFAPELERLLKQAIKRANRPRYRWITDPCKDNWYLLGDFTGKEWAKDYPDYKGLSMVNRLKAMYLNGDYPQKPQGFIRDNPLPS